MEGEGEERVGKIEVEESEKSEKGGGIALTGDNGTSLTVNLVSPNYTSVGQNPLRLNPQLYF